MIREDFFGREEILFTLDKRLRGLKDGYRQNIALLGDRLIGKTSILARFISNIGDRQIIPVYLDVDPRSDLLDFFNRFVFAVVKNLSDNKELYSLETAESLLENLHTTMPATVDKIRSIKTAILNKKKDESFYEIFELSRLINQESKKFCLIVIEEFHNLENFGLKNIYKEFGKKVILDKSAMYVITSSQVVKARKILSESFSLLFGNFEIIDVGPFDIKTADSYLKCRIELDAVLKAFIINFTEAHPFYLNAIINQTKRLSADKGAQNINLDLLISGLEYLFFNRWSILNQHYESLIEGINCRSDNRYLIKILILLSDRHNKLKDIYQIMHKTKSDALSKTTKLMEMGLVSKNGDLFKINDPMFDFWLSSVYNIRLASFILDENKKREIFQNKVKELFRDFLKDSQKAIIDRLVELFGLFTDETVSLDRKKIKLSHFRELKTFKFSGDRIKDGIIGRSSESLWLTALKEDNINEDDVMEFARECKKYKDKTQKKILFAFNDIEGNAKILAKEEKIIIWDVANVNSLLSLYGRSRIIP